jgi:hypothetical protein
MKSTMNLGVEVSEVENSQLIVNAINDGMTEPELQLDILHRPEAVGNENVAYFVFGIPGTGSYSFMDLNRLPNEMTVTIKVEYSGIKVSESRFQGSQGNQPQ